MVDAGCLYHQGQEVFFIPKVSYVLLYTVSPYFRICKLVIWHGFPGESLVCLSVKMSGLGSGSVGRVNMRPLHACFWLVSDAWLCIFRVTIAANCLEAEFASGLFWPWIWYNDSQIYFMLFYPIKQKQLRNWICFKICKTGNSRLKTPRGLPPS